MRESRYSPILLWATMLALVAFASTGLARSMRPVAPLDTGGQSDQRPPIVYVLHNLSNVWSSFLNIAIWADPSENYPGMEWPGGSGVNYLWQGNLWACCYGAVTPSQEERKWASVPDVSVAGWGEWKPHEGEPATKVVPGDIALEQTTYGVDDWNPTYNENPMGLHAFIQCYNWATPGYDAMMVTDMIITHNSEEGNPGEPLGALVVSVMGDCDVAGENLSGNNLDDMVYYDGHAIWCNDPDATFDYEFDDGTPASEADWFTYQQNPDADYADPEDDIYYYYNYPPGTEFPQPDGLVDADVDGNGVSDHFTVLAKVVGSDTLYRVEPNTGLELFADGMPENYWEHEVGDTTYWVVPRNTTYMWDSDNPSSSIDDSGEPTRDTPANGFIGWRMVDFYVVHQDGTIDRPIDVYGYPIPLSHSWWNWESDPGTDIEQYDYMCGANPDASGDRSGPTYLLDWVGDPSAPEAFEPQNPGPFPVIHQLPYGLGYPVFDYRFMLGAGPCELTDTDTLHFVGGFFVGKGLDGMRQQADILLDAYHRGEGWDVPDLPPMPTLFYEAGNGVVNLHWGANAEGYDPFGGYNIYRATFEARDWEYVASASPGTYSYQDSDVTRGYPYYYAVCAYDAETDIESPKSNYKQTIEGTPVAVTPGWADETDWTEKVNVVPNPYRGSAPWEQAYFDKIAFTHLPAVCDIYIYTLAGDHVATLEHRSMGGDDGTEYWDLLNRNEQYVTSGLYIYRVETETDHVVGKFAIIQ
jgi:hypothetical protein